MGGGVAGGGSTGDGGGKGGRSGVAPAGSSSIHLIGCDSHEKLLGLPPCTSPSSPVCTPSHDASELSGQYRLRIESMCAIAALACAASYVRRSSQSHWRPCGPTPFDGGGLPHMA